MSEVTNRFLELFYKLSQIPRESGKEKREPKGALFGYAKGEERRW